MLVVDKKKISHKTFWKESKNVLTEEICNDRDPSEGEKGRLMAERALLSFALQERKLLTLSM